MFLATSEMQRLAGFPSIAYDTNCLIFYCFVVDIPESAPKQTVRMRQTQKTRDVTEQLKANGQKITTIQDVYDELKDCVYAAVADRMAHREVEAQLGCPQDVHIKDSIKLHVQMTVEKKVRQLVGKNWFVLDREFVPNMAALQALKAFFDGLGRAAFAPSSPPGHVDRKLIHFGLTKQIPLVTNDGGISKFAANLQASGLSFHIYHLGDISCTPTNPVSPG